MIDAAIVGLGRWGRRLVDAVQENGRPKGRKIRFVRAATRTLDTARDYAATQGLALGASFDEILADSRIAAVALATPHDRHAAQIIAASAAGKHVFVEKPLALTLADGKRAVAHLREAGLVLGLGHNRRFLPAALTLKQLIADRRLGAVVHLEGNFSGNSGLKYRPGMWRAEEGGATGAMTAMGIHVVDMFIFLAGAIESVRATGVRRALTIAMDDAVSVNLRFRGGASGYLSTLLATPRHWRVQVFGTDAWAHMRDQHLLDVCGEDAVPKTQQFDAVDDVRLELEAFADAIGGGAPYPLSPAEALHGVAVLESILASSAADGKTIHIPPTGLDI